jgi:crotonobetainyl-CoA:carnitine CoA-transferase CaiB-like acyl-CoA transferase
MQAPMPKLSDTPSAIRRRAPLYPGEHNAEVYGEMLRLSGNELADLAEQGVI